MNLLEYLIIHCSYSKFGDLDIIDRWHKEKGWKSCGYNLVIPNGRIHTSGIYTPEKDGIIQSGRGLDFTKYVEYDEIGAQALGYNSRSAGICLIGIDEFTIKQYTTLYHLCKTYQSMNPNIKIIGHYETDHEQKKEKMKRKTCPNIVMDDWRDLLENGAYMLSSEIMIKMKVAA